MAKYCPNCGAEIRGSVASFCSKCGARLTNSPSESDRVAPKWCYRCEKYIYAGMHDAICPACGAQLMDQKPDVRQINAKSSKKTAALVLVVGIALVVLLLFWASGGGGSSGTKTSTVKVETANEPTREEYIALCEEVDYKTVARDPEDYKGAYVTFTGKVIQVVEGITTTTLRINQGNSYDHTWYVTYRPVDGESRILEGDRITVYGQCTGVKSYTAIFLTQVTIPSLDMKYYDNISAAPISGQPVLVTTKPSE